MGQEFSWPIGGALFTERGVTDIDKEVTEYQQFSTRFSTAKLQGDQMRAFLAMPGILEGFAAEKNVSGMAIFLGIFRRPTKLDKFGKNRSKKRFLGHAGRAFFGLL